MILQFFAENKILSFCFDVDKCQETGKLNQREFFVVYWTEESFFCCRAVAKRIHAWTRLVRLQFFHSLYFFFFPRQQKNLGQRLFSHNKVRCLQRKTREKNMKTKRRSLFTNLLCMYHVCVYSTHSQWIISYPKNNDARTRNQATKTRADNNFQDHWQTSRVFDSESFFFLSLSVTTLCIAVLCMPRVSLYKLETTRRSNTVS